MSQHTSGLAAEVSLSMLLKDCLKLINPKDLYTKNQLLTLAEKNIDTFAKDLQQIKLKEGILISELTPHLILDWIYGVDNLTYLEDVDGVEHLVALDVTTNVVEISTKLDKLHKRKSVLKELGVKYAYVIYWRCNTPYKSLSRGQKLIMAGYLTDALDNSICKKIWVDEVIISC